MGGYLTLVNSTVCCSSLFVVVFDNSLRLSHILLLFVIDPDDPFYSYKADASLKQQQDTVQQRRKAATLKPEMEATFFSQQVQ